MNDHPEHQERIAAIAAETDWLHGARSLASMGSYPPAHTVIVALLQTKNPIFAGIGATKSGGDTAMPSKQTDTASPLPAAEESVQQETHSSASSVARTEASGTSSGGGGGSRSAFVTQWNALDDALANGVITKAEYDRKLAALMAKHRSE
jgi:hypothetical protein